MLKATFPCVQEGQLIQIFKTCLDPATALQLKRKLEGDPNLTLDGFLSIMEIDFGWYFSAQAREDWLRVRLANDGQNLKFIEWLKFRLQFEVAASRVNDKDERKGYDLLFDQLSPVLPEKIIKAEKTRPEGQN